MLAPPTTRIATSAPVMNAPGGVKNPDYSGPYVFQNDFSALLPNVPLSAAADHELLVSASESGLCRVICFSPRHDLTLPQMSHEELCKVVDLWAVQYQELAAMDGINHVQIFENKGEAMGCSNPHPHGQIWAQQTVPDEAAKKNAAHAGSPREDRAHIAG